MNKPATYNEPRYYDIAFGSDIGRELAFLEAVFAKYATRQIDSVVDLACGTGRFAIGLGKRGFAVSGVDISRDMIAYAFERSKEAGVPVELFTKDVTDFQLYRTFDAAICMTGSFAYFHPAEAMEAHLGKVAEHVRQGGLYVIDATVVTGPQDDLPPPQEWQEARDRVRVVARWEVIGPYDPATDGLVTELVTLTGHERGWQRSWQHEALIRLYRAGELRELLEASGQFKLVGAYSGFALDRPYWAEEAVAADSVREQPEPPLSGGHRMLLVLLKVGADRPRTRSAEDDAESRWPRRPRRRDGARPARPGAQQGRGAEGRPARPAGRHDHSRSPGAERSSGEPLEQGSAGRRRRRPRGAKGKADAAGAEQRAAGSSEPGAAAVSAGAAEAQVAASVQKRKRRRRRPRGKGNANRATTHVDAGAGQPET